jgi:MFS family permease
VRVHYAWAVSIACIITIFICIGLVTNGFSMYMPYIKETGISDPEISLIVNIRGGVSLVAMLLIHRFYKRFSARIGMFLACICTFLAYVLYGVADGNFALYLSGSVMAGISYGLGSMIIVSEVLRRWFYVHFNLNVGVAAAGTGIATILMPIIVEWMVDTYDLSTGFLLEAIVILILSIAVLVLLRDHPSDKGLMPYGATEDTVMEDPAETHAKMDLPPSIWVRFAAVCFIMGCIGGPGLVFLSMLFNSADVSTEDIAISISLIGALMTVGKIVIGRTIDKFGTYKGMMIFGAILAVGLFLTALLDGGDSVRYMVILFLGFGFAMMMIAPASFAKDIAKEGQYFSTVRMLEIAYVLGSFVFALVPGFLASFTGTYITSYLILGVMLVAAIALISSYYLGHGHKSNA